MYYNKEFQYTLTQVPYIVENIEEIKRVTSQGVERFKIKNGLTNHYTRTDNLTWMFTQYNIYSLCSNNQHFYEIYKSLVNAIKGYFELTDIEVPSQLWLQSWVNLHNPKQVLKTHNHDWPWHGYVSIDPKKSHTVFTDSPNGKELYRVENKIGQIYLGPGSRFHHVEIDEPYEGNRITFGYDLECRDRILDNMGFIPIII